MSERQQLATVRVLLVEDEEFVRETSAEGLRSFGFEVIEAASADDAIRQIERVARWDFMVTDVRMPGSLDGIDAALYARSRHPNMPIIIVSGYPHKYVERMQQFSPAVVFINKPYFIGSIVEAAERLLGRSFA